MLELVYVVSGYGRMTILKGICIKVEKGEIVTLIGANVAGKSTTLNTICGIIPIRSGKIYFEENDITNLPTKEIVFRGITQIPEGRRLFAEMSVKENIEMGAYLRNDKEKINTDMNKIYDIFPILKEREKLSAGSLSGGEQQMLAIARGLMAKPKLLLMDEPSLGLAPMIVEQIFEIIKEINNNFSPFPELDRIFLLDVKDRLKRIFSKAVISFQNGEINEFKNLIEEIIIDTLDFEKVALGISLAQLSKDILVDSKYFNNNRITNVKQRGENE